MLRDRLCGCRRTAHADDGIDFYLFGRKQEFQVASKFLGIGIGIGIATVFLNLICDSDCDTDADADNHAGSKNTYQGWPFQPSIDLPGPSNQYSLPPIIL